MWIKINPNPLGRTEPDCVVRAICLATNKSWYEVYDALCDIGRYEASMPSVNSIWGKYLYKQGFEPFLISESCQECITVREFCKRYPYGTYIIGTGSHAVCVIDGNYLDSWDSGNETPSYFWKVR